MNTVVGIFLSRLDAENAVDKLQHAGFGHEEVVLLTPDSEPSSTVPTEYGESPGVGRAIGSVVGAAAGLAGGVVLGSFVLAGVGPVLALGIGASALGVGGAVIGGFTGKKLETLLTSGLPKDELFLYEDSLKQGRSLVVALSSGEPSSARARKVMDDCGAESIDAAREKWWIGLRDAEVEQYAPEENFANVEDSYRLGFETALNPQARGRSLEEARATLRSPKDEVWDDEAFRRGFLRGSRYYLEWTREKKSREKKSNDEGNTQPRL